MEAPVTTLPRVRYPLAAAEAIAQELVMLLSPACERIVVAGSVRRRKPEVKDLEIVAVPAARSVRDLFGEVTDRMNLLEDLLSTLVDQGEISAGRDGSGRPAWGPRYKRAVYRGLPVDLFSVIPPAQWGLTLLLRTGPWWYSKRVVTPRRHGGLLPDWMAVRDGAMWHKDGESLVTAEEEDVFRLLQVPFVDPARRAEVTVDSFDAQGGPKRSLLLNLDRLAPVEISERIEAFASTPGGSVASIRGALIAHGVPPESLGEFPRGGR